jgi:predicted nucleic acid binding AN1-type Zn finger protein
MLFETPEDTYNAYRKFLKKADFYTVLGHIPFMSRTYYVKYMGCAPILFGM